MLLVEKNETTRVTYQKKEPNSKESTWGVSELKAQGRQLMHRPLRGSDPDDIRKKDRRDCRLHGKLYEAC